MIIMVTTWFLENALPSSTPMTFGFPTWIIFSRDDICQMVIESQIKRLSYCTFWIDQGLGFGDIKGQDLGPLFKK